MGSDAEGRQPGDLLAAGDHYVAMGSSFAAGSGLRPRSPGSPRRAQRSAANYAHLVASALGLDLTDASWSGVTAAQLLLERSGRPAQVAMLTADTTLVTITCGGNDVRYLPVLALGSLPRPLRTVPAVRRRLDDLVAGTDGRFEQLTDTWEELLSGVRARAPRATVVVVDYPTLLPPSGEAAAPLANDLADWGRSTAHRLSAETAVAAERAGCLFVAASRASRDHHAWSADPWTHGFRFGRGTVPYHPNHAGMRAIADLVVYELERTPH